MEDWMKLGELTVHISTTFDGQLYMRTIEWRSKDRVVIAQDILALLITHIRILDQATISGGIVRWIKLPYSAIEVVQLLAVRGKLDSCDLHDLT